MAKKISAGNSQDINADPREITGTDTSENGDLKRGLDTNLASVTSDIYHQDRDSIKVTTRDAGHQAPLPTIEKIINGIDFDTCTLTRLSATQQVLSYYSSGTNVVEVQIEYTEHGWTISEYFGSLLLENGDYLLLENGDKLLLEG